MLNNERNENTDITSFSSTSGSSQSRHYVCIIKEMYKRKPHFLFSRKTNRGVGRVKVVVVRVRNKKHIYKSASMMTFATITCNLFRGHTQAWWKSVRMVDVDGDTVDSSCLEVVSGKFVVTTTYNEVTRLVKCTQSFEFLSVIMNYYIILETFRKRWLHYFNGDIKDIFVFWAILYSVAVSLL